MSKPIRLPKLHKEHKAAKALNVSVYTLRRLRKARKIGYTRIGERAHYTDRHLADYIEKENVEPCQDSKTSGLAGSAITGCRSDQTVRSGAGPGSIPQLGRQDAHRLAQTIFKRPN